MYKHTYKTVSFGLHGNSLEGFYISTINDDINKVSSSWYLKSPEEFLRYICPDHYPAEEVHGAWVIDKREALEKNYTLAFSSPMCDARLADDDINRFREIPGVESSLVLQSFASDHADSTQRGLAAMAVYSLADQSNEPGPLDHVSPAKYAAWWLAHGARVGVLDAMASPPRIDWME